MVNHSGTSFPLNGGVLAIAELQYAYPSVGGMVSADQAQPLARTYASASGTTPKASPISASINGVSLAIPASNGIPYGHGGDYGLYAVFDQMLWLDPTGDRRKISVFGRDGYAAARPQPRRFRA